MSHLLVRSITSPRLHILYVDRRWMRYNHDLVILISSALAIQPWQYSPQSSDSNPSFKTYPSDSTILLGLIDSAHKVRPDVLETPIFGRNSAQQLLLKSPWLPV